jgi:hypothetical protein
MNAETLAKMEELLELAKQIRDPKASIDLYEQFAVQYGALEDVIDVLFPPRKVELKYSGGTSSVYKNHIEAGFVAGHPSYQWEGYRELLKVIGKLRERVSNPASSRDERSITATVASLRRFRECTQYLTTPPENERAVQDIIWIMLRSQFDRLEREEVLPRFGLKAYRPDFGIPDLYLLIEIKFVSASTQLGDLQDQLLADLRGYIGQSSSYSSVVLFIYDHAHKLRDPHRFVEHMRQLREVSDVIIVPGIAPAG